MQYFAMASCFTILFINVDLEYLIISLKKEISMEMTAFIIVLLHYTISLYILFKICQRNSFNYVNNFKYLFDICA